MLTILKVIIMNDIGFLEAFSYMSCAFAYLGFCYRILFVCNARLFSKPNDSIKQIPLDGSIHSIYRRGAICFPWADAALSVQPGHYAVVWEAKAQRLRNDGWLTSEEYAFLNESASATPSLPASSLEQRPTPQAP